MLALTTLVALGGDTREVLLQGGHVARTDGSRFSGPAAMRAWLQEEPGADVWVTIGNDVDGEPLRNVLDVLGWVGGRPLWLRMPGGEPVGPLSLDPPGPFPGARLVGVGAGIDLQSRPIAAVGPWLAALTAVPLWSPTLPGQAQVGSVVDCGSIFSDPVEVETCTSALGRAPEHFYLGGAAGCAITDLGALSSEISRLSLAAEIPVIVEVQNDDDLRALFAGIQTLTAAGHRVALVQGRAGEVKPTCKPAPATPAKIREWSIEWLAAQNQLGLYVARAEAIPVVAALESMFVGKVPAVEACRAATLARGEPAVGEVRVSVRHPPDGAPALSSPASTTVSSTTLACVGKAFGTTNLPSSAPAVTAIYTLPESGRVSWRQVRPDLRADYWFAHYTELTIAEQVPPEYPEAAKHAHDVPDQRCLADVYVGADGVPLAVEVSGCSEVFWESTKSVILKWRWAPLTLGLPGGVWTTISMVYKMR